MSAYFERSLINYTNVNRAVENDWLILVVINLGSALDRISVGTKTVFKSKLRV